MTKRDGSNGVWSKAKPGAGVPSRQQRGVAKAKAKAERANNPASHDARQKNLKGNK